jgi:Asp-tRNA(Asn)/Glu-tRNA(Gln) amidotransferase A subunit family amidase
MSFSVSYIALLLTCLAALGNAQNTCTVFDPTEATVDSIHALLTAKTATCRQIVQGYLAKINALNSQVNAIIMLNPKALDIADAKDVLITAGTASGDLFCIPVLLKDNYDTMDMPTTGGSLSLAGSMASKGDNLKIYFN